MTASLRATATRARAMPRRLAMFMPHALRLDHFFERFWRKDRRKTDGAGLGLGIVQRLAQAHGGAITVENAQDGGALFSVTFAAP